MTTKQPFIMLTHEEIRVLSSTRSAAVFATYTAIKTFIYRGKGKCYPTRRTIAKRMGNAFTLRSITNAIHILCEIGLLTRCYHKQTNGWSFKIKEPQTTVPPKKVRGGSTMKGVGSRSPAINKKTNKIKHKYNKIGSVTEPSSKGTPLNRVNTLIKIAMGINLSSGEKTFKIADYKWFKSYFIDYRRDTGLRFLGDDINSISGDRMVDELIVKSLKNSHELATDLINVSN